MATITLDLPDALYRRVKARADRSAHHLADEAARLIEAGCDAQESASAGDGARSERRREAIARLAALNETLTARGVWASAEKIEEAIQTGRDERLPEDLR